MPGATHTINVKQCPHPPTPPHSTPWLTSVKVDINFRDFLMYVKIFIGDHFFWYDLR